MRFSRSPNPFPTPAFRPEPEGYRDMHMVGVYYKWEHPLELPIVAGALHRQSHANRLPRSPFSHLSQGDVDWHI